VGDNSRAFTAIELAIIASLVSIIFMVGAPKIGSHFDSHRLQSFDRIIIADLRYAQRQAYMNWRETRLYFSNSTRKIYIKQGRKIIKSDPYPEGVKLDYTNFKSNEVKFNEFGNPSAGGSIHISCGGIKHTITVLPVTGRVKLYEYERHSF